MKKHEALKLIIKNLNTIIPELKQLKEKIRPVFEERGWNISEVGVDVAEVSLKLTGNIKPCDYDIIVYDNAHRYTITASLVHAWVRSAVSDYQGYCCVKSGAVPYPEDSFLGLEFLKDLKKALGI
ncbi:hypothetical protein HYT26_01510 [Candidatus Pacearchaeota archaeon]|nr:hypothetical protein [Candidatus Pacearchaeota archaeon]